MLRPHGLLGRCVAVAKTAAEWKNSPVRTLVASAGIPACTRINSKKSHVASTSEAWSSQDSVTFFNTVSECNSSQLIVRTLCSEAEPPDGAQG